MLVCCAGIALPGRFLDVPADEFDEQWQANVRGSVTAIRSVPPDTDAPGFAAENLRKPHEIAAISGKITPAPAFKVAKALVRGIKHNTRNVTVEAATRTLLRFGGMLEPAVRWSFTRTVKRVRGTD